MQNAYAARSYAAPAWALDLSLGQMRDAARTALPEKLLDGHSRWPTVQEGSDIPGDWAAQAAKIIADKVNPALDRQIAP